MAPFAHSTTTKSFLARSSLPDTSPLAVYLLRLMALKRTNLCLSADVTTTSELLSLAEETGSSICLLKTHADIILDFSPHTIRCLREISKRKQFLVFEDRKFGDIGNTVKMQYTGGTLKIVRWANVTNAHIFPGPAIITALQSAAEENLTEIASDFSSEISAGRRRGSKCDDIQDEWEQGGQSNAEATRGHRKRSVVNVTTTVTTIREPLSPRQEEQFTFMADEDPATALEKLGPPPIERALLLLAEMSSADNLFTASYTDKCVSLARQHRDFVMGFIAQRGLNSAPEDNFIIMTPGVSLPSAEGPSSVEMGQGSVVNGTSRGGGGGGDGKMGDALGQQYRTPRKVVLEEGCDVVIVGRGIVNAVDRKAEAERYRREAWAAYEDRTGKRSAA